MTQWDPYGNFKVEKSLFYFLDLLFWRPQEEVIKTNS